MIIWIRKKCFLSAAVLAGIGAGMVIYFKKNPDKLQKIKCKMMQVADDVEDSMMM